LSTAVADIIKTNSKITYKDVANKLIGQYISEGKISSWHHVLILLSRIKIFKMQREEFMML
jgi:hypothetical protein